MKSIVFCTSQRLYNLDFYKDILRKTARKYESLTVRVPKALTLDSKEMIEFCEALGWNVETWAVQKGWDKYADTIRNKAMLRGFQYDPYFRTPPDFKGEADLCLIFRGKSDKDNAEEIARYALLMGSSIQLHIYREKWTKKKGHDPVFKGIVHLTRHKDLPFKLSTERWVYVPGQERKAA